MSYFALFLILISSVPTEKKVDTQWNSLTKASILYALGQTEKADQITTSLLKIPKMRLAASTVSIANYACSGNVNNAKIILNKQKAKDSEYILKTIISSFKSPFFNWLKLKKSVYNRKLSSILGNLSPELCHYKGKLFLVDKLLISNKSSKNKVQINKYIINIVKKVKLLNYKNYSRATGMKILSYKKFLQLFSGGKFTPQEQKDYENFVAAGLTPFNDLFPWRISVLVPISGRYAPLGKQILMGLLAAKTLLPGLEIMFHNTESSPGKTLKILLEEIIPSDKPMVIIAPPDKASLKIIMGKTGAIPLFSVSTPLELKNKTQNNIFYSQVTKNSRVTALINSARNKGATRFAMIIPDTKYGNTYENLFKSKIKSIKGSLVKIIKYKPSHIPKRISLRGANAVFIPGSASKVELIARIMAASGYFGKPLSKKKKGLIILSTAEALSPTIINRSLRYFNGAFFAPGFYSGAPDPSEISLVKTMNRWGITNILSYAINSYNLYFLSKTLVSLGLFDHQDFITYLRKLSAGPGKGLLFNKNGATNQSARLYNVIKGKVIRVNN